LKTILSYSTIKFKVWSTTPVLFGWYLGTLKAPINNYLAILIFGSLYIRESKDNICLAPFTEFPWNLISLRWTIPSNWNLTEGP
jgi:hypothetical protein